MRHTHCKRVAKSNHRVTQGKMYKLFEIEGELKIKDDNGKYLQPCDNQRYWQVIEQYFTISPKPEHTMLVIKDVTLINNQEADSYSIQQLIELVVQEEQLIKGLSVIKAGRSNAVDRQKEKHESNINALIVLMDSLPT